MVGAERAGCSPPFFFLLVAKGLSWVSSTATCPQLLARFPTQYKPPQRTTTAPPNGNHSTPIFSLFSFFLFPSPPAVPPSPLRSKLAPVDLLKHHAECISTRVPLCPHGPPPTLRLLHIARSSCRSCVRSPSVNPSANPNPRGKYSNPTRLLALSIHHVILLRTPIVNLAVAVSAVERHVDLCVV